MPQPPKINREEVLSAALHLLEEGGAAPLSLRAVAARLHVTPNALYWHYPDREALLTALAAHGAQELQRALDQARPAAITALTELTPVAQAYLHFARTRPHLYALLMTPRSDGQVTAELWHSVLNILTPLVGEQKAAEVGVALWAYLHGVAGLRALGPFHDQKPDSGLQAGLHALLEGFKKDHPTTAAEARA